MKNHKNITVIAAALLAVFTAAAFLPAAQAFFGGEDAYVAAFSKNDAPGSAIMFRETDFTDSVKGGDKLTHIVIAECPAESEGILKLAGKAVVKGQKIKSSDLGTLAFSPAGEDELHSSFSFYPVLKKSGTLSEAVNVALNLGGTNYAPVALDMELTTYTDLTLWGEFRSVDADGDGCTFEIVSTPSKGQVTVNGSGFTYVPSGKSGDDIFTYVAVDSYGNPSAEATAKVEICKRPADGSVTYTDLAESPVHYAAVKLSEAGVLTGEQIGSECFLRPDDAVTRGEFIAMAAVLAELPLPTAAVSTGLADNGEMPVWLRPYVVSAINCGLINGDKTAEGNRVFRQDDPITRAEAAAILDRVLALPAEASSVIASDSDNIPVWAEPILARTASAGIISVFSDGSIRASSEVTREDAVSMLYSTMKLLQSKNEKSGLMGLFK